jgi:phage tail-like protein
VGQGEYANLVLKRGFASMTLLTYLQDFHENRARMNKITVKLRANDGTEVCMWEFKYGVPVKWDGPGLNVTQNGIAIETIEIAHEGMSRFETLRKVDRTGKAG